MPMHTNHNDISAMVGRNPGKGLPSSALGGYLPEFRKFGGDRLPTHIEARNFFETDDYFPFFRVKVTSVHFPQREED